MGSIHLYDIRNNTRVLVEGITLLALAAFLACYGICLAYDMSFYWLTIPPMLFFCFCVCSYYSRKMTKFPIQNKFSTSVQEIDMLIMLISLVSITLVPAMIYLVYSAETFCRTDATLCCLSFTLLVLSCINGYILSYYHTTYKQKMNKFSYIYVLRLVLVGMFLLPFILEYAMNESHLCIFPIVFMFTLGLFFRAYFAGEINMHSIVFAMLFLVALVYLGTVLHEGFMHMIQLAPSNIGR